MNHWKRSVLRCRMSRFATAVVVVSTALTVTGASSLTEAVKRGDIAAVRHILRTEPASLNAAAADGATALHWAVLRGDVPIAERLLRAGADVNAGNRYGITPLMLAAENGDVPMIKDLLDYGADAGARRGAGDTVLMIAARTGNAGAIRLLAQYGADVNDREATMGETALMWAAGENQADAVAALIALGADVNARSAALAFPVLQWQNIGMVSSRLPRGGWTPLMHAARQGAADGVRTLVDHGADLNLQDPDGTTALVLAIINAHYDVASLLLARGADPNIADITGMNALYALVDMHTLAPMQGRPAPKLVDQTDTLALIGQLLAKGANPNAALEQPLLSRHHGPGDAVLDEGSTSLMRAAKSLDVEVMHLLLEHGASPYAANRDGLNPLMLAVQGQAPRALGLTPAAVSARILAAAALLIERGADVNAFNRGGQTALHLAADRGADEVVRFLAEHGAEPDAKDRDGRTPLDLASAAKKQPANASGGRERTVALLQQLLASR